MTVTEPAAPPRSSNPPVRLVRAYPVAAFAVLACAIGWMNYLAGALSWDAHPSNMPLGPMAAAAIVVACQGRAELRAWGRQLRDWRAAPRWYALAVLAPIALHVAIVLVNHSFGAPLPTGAQLAEGWQLPITFTLMLLAVGFGEEAGWTAFAAVLLLRRRSVLATWAVIAPIRILWHLPLMLSGELPWLIGIVGNAAFQLVVLWMMQRSGGRWQLAAVWHATLNTFGGAFLFAMVSGADNDRLGVLLSVTYALVAVAVLPAVLRADRRSDTHRSAE